MYLIYNGRERKYKSKYTPRVTRNYAFSISVEIENHMVHTRNTVTM